MDRSKVVLKGWFVMESLCMEKVIWSGAAVIPRWIVQACYPHRYHVGTKNSDSGERE